MTVEAPSRAGRKTNLERLEIQRQEREAEEALEREASRAKRYQPDTRITLAIALGIGAANLATAGAISYATLVAVAGWMKLPWDGLNWIVPGFIELLIVFSALDYLVSKSRGESATAPFWAMVSFSAIAVIGNAAHTISEWGVDFTPQNWQSLVGVVLSASAPLVVVYISKRLSSLVFISIERQ